MRRMDPISLGLPHRVPFLFVDAVCELCPGESAKAQKVFHAEEAFFAGHFPGEPLVPGVILVEALAQTAGLAAGQPGRGFRLTSIKGVKFPGAAYPNEVIDLEVKKIGGMGGLWQFEVVARVSGRTVAEGVVVLSEV